MLNYLSNEPSKTNSCTIAQDLYPWKTSINIMHLRETMGYTSQVKRHRVHQEWGMQMIIKISKSPTNTHLRKISLQVHVRWIPLGLPLEAINSANKYISNPREINITTIPKYPWAHVKINPCQLQMQNSNIMNYLANDQCTQY